MGRKAQSALYSFLFTLYGTSIYYAIGVLVTLSQNGDVVKFFFDTLIIACVMFGFLWYVFYELTGLIEQANRPRDKRDGKPDDKDDKTSGGSKPF